MLGFGQALMAQACATNAYQKQFYHFVKMSNDWRSKHSIIMQERIYLITGSIVSSMGRIWNTSVISKYVAFCHDQSANNIAKKIVQVLSK